MNREKIIQMMKKSNAKIHYSITCIDFKDGKEKERIDTIFVHCLVMKELSEKLEKLKYK